MHDQPCERTTLDNGLRILTSCMPATRSVAISIYVGAGSRYETPELSGVSHLLEHLLFKGTHKRPSPQAISEAIDGVGGVLNAGTDRELTVYYAKVAAPHFGLAADVLLDMIRDPLLAEEELEKERNVVIEELASIADSPAQLVDVLLDETMWPDQPLGRDVAGTEASVSALTRPATLEYMRRQYVPNNIVVAVAGAVAHQQVVDAVAGALGDWPRGVPAGWFPAVNGQDAPRTAVTYKRTEQAHIEIAVHALSSQHPDRYALDLISVILGEGMSSRLFMELREKRALCYDVHSYSAHYLDAGSFAVYAGVDPKKALEATQALVEELARLRDAGVTADELHKAKELSKGRLLLRMEDTRSVSGWLGGQEMINGDVKSPDEVVALIEAVTEDDVRRVCRDILREDQLSMALVGPFRTARRFAPLLRL
ncbi:MAG TPA: pitrilysin family protein [Dehalococcoidia bacterium]|nr:pitrilysin family protein [Dehalococcoidia bacterium]